MKGNKMVHVKALVMLIFIGIVPLAVYGETVTDRTVLIHVTSVPSDDESRFYSMARLAVAALEKGHTVIMFFDGKGARSVKLGSWYGGETSLLDKLDIPDMEQKTLADALGLTVASAPSNYGDLLRLFRGKGVELYVNSDMMAVYNIEGDKHDTAFVPVEPIKMMDIIDRADVYVSY